MERAGRDMMIRVSGPSVAALQAGVRSKLAAGIRRNFNG